VDKQLSLGIEALRKAIVTGEVTSVHEARRHVKKARAALRLVDPVLEAPSGTGAALRLANHLLAPISDGEAVADTFARIVRMNPRALAAVDGEVIHSRLLCLEKTVVRRVRASGALSTAIAVLQNEREALSRWTLRGSGFQAIAPGLKRCIRQARRSMYDAERHPTNEAFHRWRRRVKDHWLQLRLLEARCGGKLSACQRRLETLDGDLGELRNVALLKLALAKLSIASPRDLRRCRRVLRVCERQLRRHAHTLGARIYATKPGAAVRAARGCWQTTVTAPSPHGRTTCLRAA
jgi:hypothetical protein